MTTSAAGSNEVIVVDSATVVDALTAVAGTKALRADLPRASCTPPVWSTSRFSPLRGLTLGGPLSPTRAEDLLTDFDDLPVHRWPSAHALRMRAFQLRNNLSAYDAEYVALAEALDCRLVTRDGPTSPFNRTQRTDRGPVADP